MIAESVIEQMRRRSALDVFMEIDSDKDDEIDMAELQRFLSAIGVKGAKPEELTSFLRHLDTNKNGTVDLIEFMNYISKETNTSKMVYYKRYPKMEREGAAIAIGAMAQGENIFSDEQIITQIEEKIFEYMIKKKVKILKLHEQMDKDKNQSVGRPEFKAFFKNKIGVDLTKRDIDVIFQRFDKDHDGSISVKEFVDHLKSAINMRKSLK